MMENDVSLHDLVELFVASPTSPKSSKTESGCERYVRFRFALSAGFTGPEVPVLRPEFPAKISGPKFRTMSRDLPRASGSLRGVQKFRGKCRNFRPAQEKLPPTVGKVGDLFKGSSSPMVSKFWSFSHSSIVDLQSLGFSQSLQ